MFWIQMVLIFGLGPQVLSAELSDDQMSRIEIATENILSTKLGKAVCRDILGGEQTAIRFHLGVGEKSAAKIAATCATAEPSKWIYASASDTQQVRKLTARSGMARKYEFLKAKNDFPVESWTDPFSNTTVLVTAEDGSLNDARLTQLLAHELAVYFDAKATPAHPDAQYIPALRDLKIETGARLNPLIAITNPLNGHTLTYLRALQVELSITRELVERKVIEAPADMNEPYIRFLDSGRCKLNCVREVVESMREAYYEFALPLIAFSPHYRDLITREINNRLQNNLDAGQKARAGDTFNIFPWQFLGQANGDAIRDITSIFIDDHSDDARFKTATDFMRYDLWRLEQPALFQTTVNGGIPLLEFMKEPLLSGINVMMSSGPRVRIRTGNLEGFYDVLL